MSPRIDFDAIRRVHPLPDIVAATTKLHRAGGGWKACCPFHPDRTPSFTIFSGGTRFRCFGCGAAGDVLDYLQRAYNVSLHEAATMLDGGALPGVVRRTPPLQPDRDTIAQAMTIWRSAGPVSGTPAEAYLRVRGLHLLLPPSLRFARLPFGSGKPLPCLVALIANAENSIGGIQRTFVREDGSGKADVPAPKLSLGRLRGGAIRCAPPTGELIVTEGLEDALTLQQERGQAAWAVCGAGGLSTVELPVGVQFVIVGADADETGIREARKAAHRFAAKGRRARIIRPLDGHKDFNAALTEGRS